MKYNNLISIIITLSLVTTAIGVCTNTANAAQGLHAIKGILYIDDQIAPDGIEIQIIFPDETLYTNTSYDGNFSFNKGFQGHDEETADIRVIYQGTPKIPATNATIYVSDKIGLFYDFYIYSAAQNIPPSADTGGPYTGVKNVARSFDGSASHDTDGTIVLYEWDIDGDGTYDYSSTTSSQASHIYPTAAIYTLILRVTDNDGATDTDTTQVTILDQDTDPPSKVTGLSVQNKKDGKLRISWNAATDNVEVDYYRIFQDGINIHNTTSLSYLQTGLTNGQTYVYQVSAVDTSDNEGEKSDNATGKPTKSSSGGGGGGGGGIIVTNTPPTADASNGEPYTATVGETITFDGTLSTDDDGTIESWEWDFGDGVSGSGETISYIYDTAGTYTVTLTVSDDLGGTDTDTTTATIIQPNIPPTPPVIDGPKSGDKNTDYQYSITSTDEDNDTLTYTVDWDDGETDTSTQLPSGDAYTITHDWATAGVYQITATVSDNQTQNSNTAYILIDAIWVKTIGYLMDTDGDDTYDTFYSNATGEETSSISDDDKGSYLLDENGNGTWDWRYYIETDNLVEYEGEPADEPIDYSLWILLLILLIILVVVLYMVKRSNDKKKAKKAKQEAAKKAAAAEKSKKADSKKSTKTKKK